MSDKKLIETAFVELKKSTKGYLSIKDISLVKDLNDHDYTRKAHFILFYSKYFKNHSDSAIKFSEFGMEIASNFDTIEQYEKSLKKTDYFKIISITATVIMVFLGILNYLNNNENKELKTINANQSRSIDSLKNITDSLSVKLLRKENKTLDNQAPNR